MPTLTTYLSQAVHSKFTSSIYFASSQRSKITVSFLTRPNVFSAFKIFSSVSRFRPRVPSLSRNGSHTSKPVLPQDRRPGFLGMLKFYRRFLPNVASLKALLHDALSGPTVKGLHPITWNAVLDKPFEECKASLSQTALLAHPHSTASLALVTTTVTRVVLQQQVQDIWQPLAFFSRKHSPA